MLRSLACNSVWFYDAPTDCRRRSENHEEAIKKICVFFVVGFGLTIGAFEGLHMGVRYTLGDVSIVDVFDWWWRSADHMSLNSWWNLACVLSVLQKKRKKRKGSRSSHPTSFIFCSEDFLPRHFRDTKKKKNTWHVFSQMVSSSTNTTPTRVWPNYPQDQQSQWTILQGQSTKSTPHLNINISILKYSNTRGHTWYVPCASGYPLPSTTRS